MEDARLVPHSNPDLLTDHRLHLAEESSGDPRHPHLDPSRDPQASAVPVVLAQFPVHPPNGDDLRRRTTASSRHQYPPDADNNFIVSRDSDRGHSEGFIIGTDPNSTSLDIENPLDMSKRQSGGAVAETVGSDPEQQPVENGAALNNGERMPSMPSSKKEHHVTLASSLRAVVMCNWYWNIASLIFAPLGIISGVLKWGDVVTFCLNFMAIIPLAKMLDFATDQLAIRVGETLGGLLNASFGNAVELIVSILALKAGLTTVVQASLIGSMLSNMLFVLGFCFLLGGLVPYQKNKFQKFDVDRANLDCGLLAVVVLGFIVPAALAEEHGPAVTKASRAIAIVLFITYIAYLVFQLKTNPEGLKIARIPRVISPVVSLPSSDSSLGDDDEEVPVTLGIVAIFCLLGATVVIAVCAEYLVNSLEGLSEAWNISQTFIGLIILPIVGNAAEHVTAVSSAMRNKMDLALQVAIGSSMQIALFVVPFLILIGWMIGVELTLNFNTFQTAVLFVSIFVVNALIQDGKSHWLEGWMLLASYLIIAIAFVYT
ncbi:hypothetical protein HK101_009665 [Irineochytrium annulatum]|nr:hypothetical protein HK101_009665 [Irineochytrium annulatum]